MLTSPAPGHFSVHSRGFSGGFSEMRERTRRAVAALVFGVECLIARWRSTERVLHISFVYPKQTAVDASRLIKSREQCIGRWRGTWTSFNKPLSIFSTKRFLLTSCGWFSAARSKCKQSQCQSDAGEWRVVSCRTLCLRVSAPPRVCLPHSSLCERRPWAVAPPDHRARGWLACHCLSADGFQATLLHTKSCQSS